MRLAYGRFFGLDHRADAGPGFTVRTMRADPNRRVEPHVHEGAHAVAILGGTYRSLASPGATLGAGEIVFNPHGTEHADTFDGEDGRFLTISYDPVLYPSLAGDAARPFVLDGVPALAAVFAILRQLASLGRSDPFSLEAAALQIASLGAPAIPEPAARHLPRWAFLARDRLASGEAGVSVANLASQEGMHPVAFSRAFRRYFGKAPLAYGLEARLRGSAQELARGASPISDIALKWGFFDQAHFSRHFQNRFGAPPGQFRRAIQS